MIKGKDILITGGAGFIGSHLVERLMKNNRIIVVDNHYRTGRKIEHKNVTYDDTNILDLDNCEGCADIVIHCAAIAGIDSVVVNPVHTLRVNLLGTENILKTFAGKKIKRFVLFSTSEVYGPSAVGVKECQSSVIGTAGHARWIYASSKMMCEHMAHAYSKQFGMPISIIRPFNVYGPWQNGEGALVNFVGKAIKNKDIEIYGDGTRIRSWCYVDDLVDGVLKAVEAPPDSYNIGNPMATVTVYELAKTIKRVLNSKSRIVFKKDLSADIDYRIPNIDKSRKNLHYLPKIDLETGILRTAEWLR